ncbi:PI-PLC X domain-containing protein 2 [Exaiptasia diaphana]|nr:PI-PLC X domain-containing protein 2 [Exaiptasia diaphana]
MHSPKDMSKWMESLPAEKQNSSLQSLVIPGSHDSCSFSIRKDLEVSPGESKWLKALAHLFPKTIKSIIYNWSVTQSYNIYQQLKAGIRYLDLRVAKRPKDGTYRVVHGLYGATLSEMLAQVKTFLKECPKEIVILDFNHFYGMTSQDHTIFSNSIKSAFGKTLRPPGSQGVNVTLKELWENNENILAFYLDAETVKNNPCFWPNSKIYSPWANTSDLNTLLHFLENETESKLPPEDLHIAQGLLTPNAKVLLANISKSLKTTLALKATDAVTTWLDELPKNSQKKLNIIIVDFVESDNFASM